MNSKITLFKKKRKNKKCIESIDFEMASERILGGLEKKRIVSYEERKIVAVHESGHAIVSWFLEGGNPLVKVILYIKLQNIDILNFFFNFNIRLL